MMNIILMGCPGAGKGTQSAKLKDFFELKHISTGDVLRAEIASGSALGKEVKDLIAQGNLVPDGLMISILENIIKTADNGVILDGFPRTTAQAEALKGMLAALGKEISKVIMIDLPEEEVVKRLSSRRLCRECGKIAQSVTESVCGACGGELYTRADDTPQSVKHRLEVYRRDTLPVINYYENSGKFVKINGNQPVEKVFEDIKKSLEEVK
jgi:adenylate kinase